MKCKKNRRKGENIDEDISWSVFGDCREHRAAEGLSGWLLTNQLSYSDTNHSIKNNWYQQIGGSGETPATIGRCFDVMPLKLSGVPTSAVSSRDSYLVLDGFPAHTAANLAVVSMILWHKKHCHGIRSISFCYFQRNHIACQIHHHINRFIEW